MLTDFIAAASSASVAIAMKCALVQLEAFVRVLALWLLDSHGLAVSA